MGFVRVTFPKIRHAKYLYKESNNPQKNYTLAQLYKYMCIKLTPKSMPLRNP